MTVLRLALRSLSRNAPRYVFIGTAIVLAFALITTISALSDGAMAELRAKSYRYFSGTASVTGYENGRIGIPRADEAVAMLAAGLPGASTVSKRSLYYRDDALLAFNGEIVRQRRIVGADFRAEAEELRGLSLRAGSLAPLEAAGSRSILVSTVVSEALGCAVGDAVELRLSTDSGQDNAATLIVAGVFDEGSLFGYVSYLGLDTMNELTGRSPGYATDIAVYAKGGESSFAFAERVRQVLSAKFAVYEAFRDKAERDVAVARGGGLRLAVLAIDAQLAQIGDLMKAVLIVSRSVLAVFSLIVMVGIMNTYRILIDQRSKEIGTMRAIGMQSRSVLAMIMAEAGGLVLASCACGLAVGAGILAIVSGLDLSRYPAAGFFTAGGRLVAALRPGSFLVNLGMIAGAVGLAAFGPARKAARIQPAEALRSS